MDGGHSAPFDFVGEPIIYENGAVVAATVDAFSGQVSKQPPPVDGAIMTWSGIVINAIGNEVIVQQRKFGVGDGVTTTFNLTPADESAFNEIGYNFQGGGDESVSILSDVRYACLLRYVSLVANGRQQWINFMLTYIFNDGVPFDMASGKYFYLTDATEDGSAMADMTMEYHIGQNLPLSSQFLNILNNPEYGIIPQCSGVSYVVLQD